MVTSGQKEIAMFKLVTADPYTTLRHCWTSDPYTT